MTTAAGSAKLPFRSLFSSGLFFGTRMMMLLCCFVGAIAWVITGFNVSEGSVPLIAIQWSTFLTFAAFAYILMVNLQLGGLKSPGQLGEEFMLDLKFIRNLLRHKKDDRDYTGAVDGYRAVMISLLVPLGCLFIFEMIWVPLYDYFQFGSITWPVYFAQETNGLWSTPVFRRNVIDSTVPVAAALVVFLTFREGSLKVKLRGGKQWLFLLILAAELWGLWILYPHLPVPVQDVTGQLVKAYSPAACYLFPSQGYFPQNTYTFYPCGIVGQSYQLNLILGFFNPDPLLHALNVLTKFATFAAVCYPFMAKVSLNKTNRSQLPINDSEHSSRAGFVSS